MTVSRRTAVALPRLCRRNSIFNGASKTMQDRFGFPDLGIGVGLRTAHYRELLEHEPAVDWLEVLSENFMQTQGRPLEILDQLAERYPLVMHGVSLSIGSTDPLDWDYLRELKALRQRIGAHWLSDHLCWTGVAGRNSHDLLPLPFSEEALLHTARRVREVQNFLGAPLVLENPSSYVEFAGTPLKEWEFLTGVVELSGAGILLDVNNVYVSAKNHGFDPETYLAALPMERVVQIHVAGHTDYGTHAIDTHVGPVPDPVWQLLARARQLGARAPVLLEWDAEIPSFAVAHAEAKRARQFLDVPDIADIAGAA
jgi:uncharacterized protein (UPF0276 family)